jgi:quercetin dioxygenase-like cupin family protein
MSTTTTTADRTFHNPVIRDWATFVETTEESGGARTLVDVVVSPGGGNRPHRHPNFAERVEVIEGRLDVLVGREWHAVEAGHSAVAEIGVKHAFRNSTGAPVRFLVEISPGHRGFERCLQIGYGLAADGLTDGESMPRNPLHTAVLLEMSGMRLTGALRLATPLIGVLARVARGRGIDRELEARYVRC